MLAPILPSMNRITVDGLGLAAKRASLTASFQFRLPAAWIEAGSVHFELAGLLSQGLPLNLPCEDCTNFAAPFQPRWVRFRPTRPLSVVLAPFEYLRSTTGKTPHSTTAWMALQWLNNVYPLRGDFPGDHSGIRLLKILPLGSTSEDLVFPSDGREEFVGQLAWMRFVLRQQHPGTWPSDFQLLAVTPCECGGRSNGGSTAFVDSWSVERGPVPQGVFAHYGGVWAHEIAHSFGREHAGNDHLESTGGEVDSGFPLPHGGLGQPGLAIATRWWENGGPVLIGPGNPANVHPHDFMSYGGGEEWISPYTYRALFSRLATSAAAAPPGPAQEKLIVIGYLRTDGSAALQPFRRMTTGLASSPGDAGAFRIDLLDAAGTILASHHFDAVAGGESTVLRIEEYVPWKEGTRRIALSGPGGPLATRKVSANAPWVRVTGPARGQARGKAGPVTWRAGDGDGDALTFTLLYSTGPGEPWIPIVGETGGSSAVVDTDLLPGSRRARIRILATDGVNTAQAESAAFVVADKPPSVDILGPADGTSLPAGAPLVLAGAAYDPEEGLLAGRSLSWSSDRDGPLGYGARLEARPLSPGSHEIMLTARDRLGQSHAARVRVEIGRGGYPRAD